MVHIFASSNNAQIHKNPQSDPDRRHTIKNEKITRIDNNEIFDAYFVIFEYSWKTINFFYDLLSLDFVAPFQNIWPSDIFYDIPSSSSSNNQTIANVKLGQSFWILRFKSKRINL